MPFKSYAEQSTINFGRTLCEKQYPTDDELKLACFQRIADALELMSQNHQRLISERDQYQRWWKEKQTQCESAQRRIAGLKGYITRLKKQ